MVDKQAMRQSVWTWGIEVLHSSSKTITALSIVLVFLATAGAWVYERLISEPLAEELRELNGTPEILEAVDNVVVEQTMLRGAVEDLSDRVDSLEPEPVVVVFDPLRSWIQSDCTPGEMCRYGYFLRRANNIYGNTCRTFSAERIFVDNSGVEFFPSREGASSPRTLSTTPTMVTGNFIVPREVHDGDGEFFMRVVYDNCGPNGDEIVQRETMKLVTTIVPAQPGD